MTEATPNVRLRTVVQPVGIDFGGGDLRASFKRAIPLLSCSAHSIRLLPMIIALFHYPQIKG